MDLESEVNSKFSASNHINIDASSLQCTSTHIQANLLPSPPQALTAMEPVGLDLDASWSCFDPSTPVDVSEFMAQFFSLQNFPNEEDQEPNTMFWPDHNAESYYCSSNSNYCSCNWTQDDCSIMPGNCKGEPSQMLPVFSHHQIDGPLCANEEASNDEAIESTAKTLLYTAHASQATKRKLRAGDVQESREDYDSQIGTTPNKNARKTKKGDRVQSKKSQRIVTSATEDESNASYSSEDDSNGSQELKEAGSMSSSLKGSLNLNQNGKKRAGRGSATDPQSLYARKRRERINERLKILQNLVPNGTKVDISTMLEEAVQYVKFLQLQIKLLSSDDLWMYAPIAYNGMNLGVNLNISS